eukprot:1139526-Pelagomonas_calceolata.AAC.6
MHSADKSIHLAAAYAGGLWTSCMRLFRLVHDQEALAQSASLTAAVVPWGSGPHLLCFAGRGAYVSGRAGGP